MNSHSQQVTMAHPWCVFRAERLTFDVQIFDRMNIWQGKFPTSNTAEDGYIKTAPVDAYGPQNDP